MGATATLTLLADAISSAQNFIWVFATVYTLVIFVYILSSWVRMPLTRPWSIMTAALPVVVATTAMGRDVVFYL